MILVHAFDEGENHKHDSTRATTLGSKCFARKIKWQAVLIRHSGLDMHKQNSFVYIWANSVALTSFIYTSIAFVLPFNWNRFAFMKKIDNFLEHERTNNAQIKWNLFSFFSIY